MILAGDFNVSAERSRTLRDLTGPEWGFSQPGPGIDHVLVRGAAVSRGAALARRRSARTTTGCCRIMRPWRSTSDELGRRTGAVPGARAVRVLQRRHQRPAARGRPLDAMADLRSWEAANGRGGKAYFDAMIERRERVRALFAQQLAVPAEHVALTESTTQGVHVVVTGLALGPADEVVTTDAEHFGLTGPLFASDATLRIARVRDAPAEDVFELVRARGDAAHAADRDLGRVVVRREGLPVAGAARRRPGCRSSSTAPSLSARSTSTRPRPTSTRSARRSGSAARIRRARCTCATPSRCRRGSSATRRRPRTTSPRERGSRSRARRASTPAFTPPSSSAGLEAALSGLPAGRFARAAELTDVLPRRPRRTRATRS